MRLFKTPLLSHSPGPRAFSPPPPFPSPTTLPASLSFFRLASTERGIECITELLQSALSHAFVSLRGCPPEHPLLLVQLADLSRSSALRLLLGLYKARARATEDARPTVES